MRGGLSKGWTWVVILLAGGAFGAFLLRPVWQPMLTGPRHGRAPAELAAIGATIYRANCAVCHGEGAEGQVPGQPMGGQRADGVYIAPALNGTGHMWHHAPGLLFDIVKFGSPAADSPMRGWEDRLSDEEIHAVLAYLQSLWPDRLRDRYRGMHRQG